MLAKQTEHNKLPLGLLVLVALVICLFAAPLINAKIQTAANEDPLPTQKVWDDDIEKRFTKMQSQIDLVMYDMQRLQAIYGPQGVGCESLPDAAAFSRCQNLQRAQAENAQYQAQERMMRARQDRPR